MSETRGYQTINDRTDFWGPGVVELDQPTADAPEETRNTRIAKLKKVRTKQKAETTPDNLDRTKGEGGVFVPTAGSDNGYRTDGPDAVWTAEALSLGTDFDLDTATGSDTAYASTDAEVDGSRATKPLPVWESNGSLTLNASYTSDPIEAAAS